MSNGTSNNNHSGLSSEATTAIAVVVPVVVVALLVLAGIFWWRRRKSKKTAQEARRKEVEEYGYNPNHDPTLPAVGGSADSPDMTEDASGYRGWGNNPTSVRKQSTNLSSGVGMAVSDDDQHQPGSSEHHNSSEGGHSEQPLVDGHMGMGAAGAAGVAGAAGAAGAAGGMKRGPSNASSQYSAAGQTDDSDDRPAEHGYDTNYSQYTPYRPGATNYEDNAQPVIQDVSARRNTKIENPSTMPKQGSSGIAANF